MEARKLYKCCAPDCPGQPYRATERTHAGCAPATVEVPGPDGGPGRVVVTKAGLDQIAAQIERQRRAWPPLRVVSPEFMNTAADALAATRRFTEAVAEAGKARQPLDTNATLSLVEDARRQLAKVERDLVRAVYRQERS